ncbi:MAG: toxin HicA [Anaerolineae bacterium]|jgi:hypothetical protein|nr:toxin HicA [Anaerolineae bacterium]
MPSIHDIIAAMRANQTNVRFADLRRVCDHYFGPPRQGGGSHLVYRMPWIGDPRVNIQDDRGRAKAYQVRQVLKAIQRMEQDYGLEE